MTEGRYAPMAQSDGSSASAPRGVKPLPLRPDLEHLKNQAKKRLQALRRTDPTARLADAQYALAKEYGFTSWRALKAQVDRSSQAAGAVGAVQNGDLDTLNRLIDDDPTLVNAAVEDREVRAIPTDTRAMRLLHVAVAENQSEAARLLLQRGADPDLRNADGRTPLHDSLELGRFDIETLLREHGATVDICSAAICGEIDVVRGWLDRDPALANDGSTHLSPVGWAAFGGRFDVIRLLAERGAALDASETLWPAAQTGRTELAAQLVGLGVDVNAPAGARRRTALHACSMMNYTEDASGVARVLLDAGADANVQDADGKTPLDLALETWLALTEQEPTPRRFERVIDALREHGGVARLEEEAWRRLAVRAALRGDAAMLKHVLDLHPASIDAVGGQWDQPLLHLAAAEGHLNVVDELLGRGFDVNTRDKMDNAYAMHFAAAEGRLDVVQRLAEAGGDVHGDGDDHELGVLGWATCFDHVRQDVADDLLSRGARLHLFSAIALDRVDDVRRMIEADPALLTKQMSRNEHRRLPLHHAVHCNRPRIVRLLLDLGADATRPDAAGAAPMTYASNDGVDPAIVTMLSEAGAGLDLLSALSLGRYDAAEKLVRDDPARIGPDGRDTIALHLSAARRKTDAVRWLIGHGVAVNARRVLWDCDMTALHVCCEHGLVEIARLLLDAGADPSIRDGKYDGDALGWCEYCQQPDVAALIRERLGGA